MEFQIDKTMSKEIEINDTIFNNINKISRIKSIKYFIVSNIILLTMFTLLNCISYILIAVIIENMVYYNNFCKSRNENLSFEFKNVTQTNLKSDSSNLYNHDFNLFETTDYILFIKSVWFFIFLGKFFSSVFIHLWFIELPKKLMIVLSGFITTILYFILFFKFENIIFINCGITLIDKDKSEFQNLQNNNVNNSKDAYLFYYLLLIFGMLNFVLSLNFKLTSLFYCENNVVNDVKNDSIILRYLLKPISALIVMIFYYLFNFQILILSLSFLSLLLTIFVIFYQVESVKYLFIGKNNKELINSYSYISNINGSKDELYEFLNYKVPCEYDIDSFKLTYAKKNTSYESDLEKLKPFNKSNHLLNSIDLSINLNIKKTVSNYSLQSDREDFIFNKLDDKLIPCDNFSELSQKDFETNHYKNKINSNEKQVENFKYLNSIKSINSNNFKCKSTKDNNDRDNFENTSLQSDDKTDDIVLMTLNNNSNKYWCFEKFDKSNNYEDNQKSNMNDKSFEYENLGHIYLEEKINDDEIKNKNNDFKTKNSIELLKKVKFSINSEINNNPKCKPRNTIQHLSLSNTINLRKTISFIFHCFFKGIYIWSLIIINSNVRIERMEYIQVFMIELMFWILVYIMFRSLSSINVNEDVKIYFFKLVTIECFVVLFFFIIFSNMFFYILLRISIGLFYLCFNIWYFKDSTNYIATLNIMNNNFMMMTISRLVLCCAFIIVEYFYILGVTYLLLLLIILILLFKL